MKNFRNLLNNILLACMLTSLLPACQMENDLRKTKEEKTAGYLDATVVPSSTEPMLTRATADTYDVNNFPVTITRQGESSPTRSFASYRAMKEEGLITLTEGNYTLKVWYGDSTQTVQTEPYFEGVQTFTIAASRTALVETVCRLDMVKVQVNLDDDFMDSFSDYFITMNYNGTIGMISRDSISKEVYFRHVDNVDKISVSVTATQRATQKNIIQTFDLETSETELKAGDSFYIHLKTDATGQETVTNPTLVGINISVDLKMNDRDYTIPIEVTVVNGESDSDSDSDSDSNDGSNDNNADDTLPTLTPSVNDAHIWAFTLKAGEQPNVAVKISAPLKIEKLLIQISTDNEAFMGIIKNAGLTDFELCHVDANSGTYKSLQTFGIPCNDDILGKTEFNFDITTFMMFLSDPDMAGEHHFAVTVTDTEGNSANNTLVITSDTK